MATHSSFLAWKISWTEEPGQAIVHGVAKSQTRLSDFTHFTHTFQGQTPNLIVPAPPGISALLLKNKEEGRHIGANSTTWSKLPSRLPRTPSWLELCHKALFVLREVGIYSCCCFLIWPHCSTLSKKVRVLLKKKKEKRKKEYYGGISKDVPQTT